MVGMVRGAMLAMVIAGCAGGLARQEAPGLTADGTGEGSAGATVRGSVVREADVPSHLRWITPFAVTSSGRVAPLEPRLIVVVDADPAIAAGIEEQRSIELRARLEP